MPLRYHKVIKLGDFIKLNMNKNSMSVSAGVPGVHFNFGPAGPMVNVDLPGNMSYRHYFGKSKKEEATDKREEKEEAKAEEKKAEAKQASARKAESEQAGAEPREREEEAQPEPAGDAAGKREPVESKAAQPEPPAEPIVPRPPRAKAATNHFKAAPPAEGEVAPERAPMPAAEKVPPEEAPFQLGFIAYEGGSYVNAYRHFTSLIDTPYRADALLMAGITACYLERDDEAVTYLGTLLEEGQPPLPGDPESLVTRYLPEATINIPITQFTAVDLSLNLTAALFLYIELLQADNQLDSAIAVLGDVFHQNPDFKLVQLSLADLYFAQGRYDNIYSLFARHTPGLEAEDDVAVEIMYYWAVALTTQEMYDAADKVYKRALARKKGINPDLRLMVHYGCADLYERWGKTALARKGFEHVFAEAPDFFDVKERIDALAEAQAAAG